MNKELAIKIFREAAELIADGKEDFACHAVDSAAEIYGFEDGPKYLLEAWFKPSNSCVAFYSYDENGDPEPYFRAGSEKGKLGRAIMLDLMAEMIEMGDIEL